jgi:hypothetical protein
LHSIEEQLAINDFAAKRENCAKVIKSPRLLMGFLPWDPQMLKLAINRKRSKRSSW